MEVEFLFILSKMETNMFFSRWDPYPRPRDPATNAITNPATMKAACPFIFFDIDLSVIAAYVLRRSLSPRVVGVIDAGEVEWLEAELVKASGAQSRGQGSGSCPD